MAFRNDPKDSTKQYCPECHKNVTPKEAIVGPEVNECSSNNVPPKGSKGDADEDDVERDGQRSGWNLKERKTEAFPQRDEAAPRPDVFKGNDRYKHRYDWAIELSMLQYLEKLPRAPREQDGKDWASYLNREIKGAEFTKESCHRKLKSLYANPNSMKMGILNERRMRQDYTKAGKVATQDIRKFWGGTEDEREVAAAKAEAGAEDLFFFN